MIPGPFTFWILFRVTVHLAIGVYFLVAAFQNGNIGAKLSFSICCLAMIIFAYNDWMLLRMN